MVTLCLLKTICLLLQSTGFKTLPETINGRAAMLGE